MKTPNCPKCGSSKLRYNDDRDEDGTLTQRPWWECENCDHREGIYEPKELPSDYNPKFP